jgi:hypothetical protein
MPGIAAYSPVALHDENRRARAIRHSGVRVGEIIGYRAWRILELRRSGRCEDRLRSVAIWEYVWDPDKPASGDVQVHGVYSFRHVVRSKEDYTHALGCGPLLFGRAKIWGEVVEHEWGYRSQFARIASLDYGDPELLEKFRLIYCVPLAPATGLWQEG